MAGNFTVKQGDHLSKIARAFGFSDYHTIWDHPENSKIKQQRENPNVLFPGDSLFIPDLRQRDESCGTDKLHKFVAKKPSLRLRLALEDLYEKPIANAQCLLILGGRSFNVTTDANGRIEQDLAPEVHDGVLVIQDAQTPFKDTQIPVKIGDLDPADQVSGQKVRLNSLGYFDTTEPRARFEEHHLQLLSTVGAIAAATMETARRIEHLTHENERLSVEMRLQHNMIGEGPRMRGIYELIEKVAPSGSTVLICGESGTGKELAARAIHTGSARAAGPFVAINCAALSESLIESELFGHEKGSFTGAIAQKKGKVELAAGGTLFLDEIGELALGQQAKLLRVLQEREFERVGGTRPIRADIRLIAATNRDLPEQIRKGAFRQDLYYRLNVVSFVMPPLRERMEDMPLLASYFATKYARQCNRSVTGVSRHARELLSRYDWPGNVRELANAIERAVVLGTTEEILADDLPDSIAEAGGESMGGAAGNKFHETIRDLKRQLVLKAMDQAKQNYTDAARLLGLHPNNLHRLIKNLNLKSV